VGIFSFLTGKKEDEAAETSVGLKPVPTSVESRTSAATAVDSPTSARSDVGAGFSPPDTPHAAGSEPPHAETPFTPPEAWNIDALTAPKPDQPADKPDMGPLDAAQTATLQPKIVEALKTVYDPEIPVDIYELGLIYGIDVDTERRVLVHMTLTSPACPSAQQIPSEVRYKIKAIPDVKDAWVEIVWEPPWDKDRMSVAAKLHVGFF
jgi:FeS assembly SUF system protein